MRLTELDPHWLMLDGRRVGLIFRSPADREWWQTCFVEPFYLFKGRDGTHHSDDEAYSPDSQGGIIERCIPEAVKHFQGCNPAAHWTIAGGIDAATFETMSVTPSLDGGAGGLWHGFITNGEIVGGL